MQHAETTEQIGVELWRRARVSVDGTHHVVDGSSLYKTRFDLVREYHTPGFAPARNSSGAFHIDVRGVPAYGKRYLEAWGFYEGLAAVEESRNAWLHINVNGSPIYANRYDWCGNFQGSRCAVRSSHGLYGHIDLLGRQITTMKYLYAGDYREQAAVVRYADDGLCGHVDANGKPLHTRRFIDLDVFHKGYARARDRRGWFHVSRDGLDAYRDRFASVEPFYNGTSLAETDLGARVLVTPDGRIARTILKAIN